MISFKKAAIILLILFSSCFPLFVNAQDSLTITQLGSIYNFFDSPTDVAIEGDYVYVTDGHPGLHIINISEPENPERVTFFDVIGYTKHVLVEDNLAYVTDSYGFVILDITDPSNPQQIGQYGGMERAFDLSLVDTLAFVTCYRLGQIQIVNVADPENPEFVNSFVTRLTPWSWVVCTMKYR